MNKTPVRFEYYILVIGSKKINLTSFKGVHPFQNQKNTESSLQLSTFPPLSSPPYPKRPQETNPWLPYSSFHSQGFLFVVFSKFVGFFFSASRKKRWFFNGRKQRWLNSIPGDDPAVPKLHPRSLEVTFSPLERVT